METSRLFRPLRSDRPYLLVALAGAICMFLALAALGVPKLAAELLALFIATIGYGWALPRRDEPELSKMPSAFLGFCSGR